MARRDLEVRVRADVGAYQKAMSAAVSSTDELAQAGLRMQKLGLSVSNLGDTLTKNVTLPLAAIGVVATKMAMDFDKSFTTMQTLAGVSAKEVDGLKESVLDLSGETGRAPQELAEALYFLQSSGLDSAQAMEALEVSAKGSAAGLGSTVAVADAVSSAMLGYAKSGLSAAEATDVLVATAREGKAEPAELAAQMGRLIPVASELGIKFGDVGGAIAALSTKGFNAEQATTALANVMAKLLKPSEQAAKLLESVGLSTDTIRQSIAEKGLLATLEELRAKLGDAGFVKFLEDQQAVQGGLALLGGDLKATQQIFDDVNNSVGATDNAFATWAESMGAENAQAFASFQVALIKIGDLIAPIATDILNFASTIVEAFSALPDGAQQAIIYFGLIAAAVGPLLSIGGRLITLFGTTTRMLSELALPVGTVAGAFNQTAVSATRFSGALRTLGIVGAVVAGLLLVREAMQAIDDEAERTSLSKLQNELLDLASTGEASGATLKRIFEGDLTGDSPEQIRQFAADLDQLDKALAELASRDPEAAAAAFQSISAELRESGASADQVKSSFDLYGAAVEETALSNRTAAGAAGETTGALTDQTGAIEQAQSALEAYADALKAQFDPLFGMISASNGVRDAQTAVAEAQVALNEAMAGGDATAIAEAQRDYDDALVGASEALVDVQGAQAVLNNAIAHGDVKLADAQQSLYNWAIQAGFTGEEALIMAGQLGTATSAAQTLGAQNPTVDVGATGIDSTINAFGRVHAAVNALPSSRNIEINFNVRVPAGVDIGRVLTFRQHGGPVHAGQAYVVGERQPELFVPKTDGMIIPSVPPLASPTAWGGGGGGRPEIIEVHSHVHLDGREVAYSVRQYDRDNGRPFR